MAATKEKLDLTPIVGMVKIPEGEIRSRADIEHGSVHLITLDGLQVWDEAMMKGLVEAAMKRSIDGVVENLPPKEKGAKIVLAVQVLP